MILMWYICTTHNQTTMKVSFATFIKEKRISAHLTLREFCRLIGFDASNWSKIERGLATPPQSRSMLDLISDVLNIKKGSEDYLQMLDLAALSSVSTELIDSDILEQLPVFFRTVRGDNPSNEELNQLVQKIKSAWTPDR